ncbi:MAG: peptidylprolyl isomerase, partial [Planctomycetota bacterium]
MRAFVLLSLLVFFLNGCQNNSKSDSIEIPVQKTNLTKTSEGLVLTIAGESITSDEIVRAATEQLNPLSHSMDYERFKKQLEPHLQEIITAKIANIMLYQEAKKNTREDIDQLLERPAEDKIREYIMNFEGDYAKAEDALKQQGMDWAGFKKLQKKMILTEYYIASLLPKPVPIT